MFATVGVNVNRCPTLVVTGGLSSETVSFEAEWDEQARAEFGELGPEEGRTERSGGDRDRGGDRGRSRRGGGSRRR